MTVELDTNSISVPRRWKYKGSETGRVAELLSTHYNIRKNWIVLCIQYPGKCPCLVKFDNVESVV